MPSGLSSGEAPARSAGEKPCWRRTRRAAAWGGTRKTCDGDDGRCAPRRRAGTRRAWTFQRGEDVHVHDPPGDRRPDEVEVACPAWSGVVTGGRCRPPADAKETNSAGPLEPKDQPLATPPRCAPGEAPRYGDAGAWSEQARVSILEMRKLRKRLAQSCSPVMTANAPAYQIAFVIRWTRESPCWIQTLRDEPTAGR